MSFTPSQQDRRTDGSRTKRLSDVAEKKSENVVSGRRRTHRPYVIVEQCRQKCLRQEQTLTARKETRLANKKNNNERNSNNISSLV